MVVRVSRYYGYNHNLTGGLAVRSIMLCGTGSSTGWYFKAEMVHESFHFRIIIAKSNNL